jgi:GT2 family glycosyltransferase
MGGVMAKEGVSFIIPNWNHEVFLPRAIRSAMSAIDLLRNERRPAEAIVVDHASRDGSRTLLRQLEALYYDDGLHCLAFDANEGLGASRNQGARHARFRYMVFLDADNELIPENLPVFIRSLEQTGAAACYGNLLIRTATAHHAHYLLSHESFQMRMFQVGGCYLDAFSVWDRHQFLDVGGYDESLRAAEDYDLWLHLATSGRRIIFVPAALGYYYLLQASLSSDLGQLNAATARMIRVFNQGRFREHLPLSTLHLMYHPELAYI